MLYHYLDHKRKESSAQLNATYLVSGKFVENGQTSHKVSVVREDQLEDAKSKMSLTVSVHVYSVQKAVLKDSGPLYSVDYDAVKDNLKNCSRYSAIRCAGAVPMSSVEVQQAREMQVPTPEPQTVKSGHTNLASKPSAKPPKGIMGMFANKTVTKNQDTGKGVKLDPKEEAPVVEAPKSKPAAKRNPMTNFFGTQAAKKPDKPVKKDEEGSQSASSAEQRPQTSRPAEVQEAVAVEQPKETTKKKDSRTKTKRIEDSDSEDEKMEKKKRRRIKKPQPDSSDDDDVIPDSPQPKETRQPSPSPEREVKKEESVSRPNYSENKRRKRRRVLKSRTFVDEDGCIVTEKGYESESYSETEDDARSTKPAPKDPAPPKIPASKKENEKKSHKKAAANANKGAKQASIMGFFQKK
ncbi:DNA polymerase delta subunit 3 [Diretmus argenteus]